MLLYCFYARVRVFEKQHKEDGNRSDYKHYQRELYFIQIVNNNALKYVPNTLGAEVAREKQTEVEPFVLFSGAISHECTSCRLINTLAEPI